MSNPQPVEKLLSEAKEKASEADVKQIGANSFVGQVWQTLSRIDCTDFIEKKGTGNFQLSYLSWAHAWGTLMEWFPESDYAFDEPHTFPDGTQEVWVTVWVKQGENISERRMWLPVMNHQNKPIINPNAFQVNTTRMRCLTKCLALFGLGHYIYAGEDIPRKENDEAAVGDRPIDDPWAQLNEKATKAAHDTAAKFDELFTTEPAGNGRDRAIPTDEEKVQEILDWVNSKGIPFKLAVWSLLPSATRSYLDAGEKR